jgi:hypothetical protein
LNYAYSVIRLYKFDLNEPNKTVETLRKNPFNYLHVFKNWQLFKQRLV